MPERQSSKDKDPASKSKLKGPRPYQGYIIAIIIIIIAIFYSILYW